MQPLKGAIRNYPWGSRTMLAQLRGVPSPSERPEAEMWFGAHPTSSSSLKDESLYDAIAADPQAALGSEVVERFGNGLPFLVKLLAAGEPLSLQAHPSKSQAEEGFARENAQGIALSAPERNYRDDNHKPEIIIALTEFHALSGFRPVALTRELFDTLGCESLTHYRTLLDADESEDSLRALFTTWITIPSGVRINLINDIVEAAQPHLDRGDWIAEVLATTCDLNERYPGDAGVLGALLLNRVTLQPGEAMFTDAGQLHAYLEGLGVEVMANSDNVLRGGLTAKYVDVPELVRVLRFSTTEDPRIDCVDGTYQAPVKEFVVTRIELAAGEALTIPPHRPVIVLCVAGAIGQEGPAGALWAAADDSDRVVTAGPNGAHIFVVSA